MSASRNSRKNDVLLGKAVVDGIATGEGCGVGIRGCAELDSLVVGKN